jgi:C4-dicarboxylate-specific signal transduction histidine kinase
LTLLAQLGELRARFTRSGLTILAILAIAEVPSMLSEIEARDAELQQHRDRLERQVAARTAELVEAKDRAEAATGPRARFRPT